MDGTAGKCIDGEAAGVAEKVKYAAACGKGTNPGAVFPLVQEEAGLLALGPVYQEFVAVFEDGKLVLVKSRCLVQIAVNQLQAGLEGGCAGTFVLDGLKGIPVHFLKGRADGDLGTEHANGVRLENADAVVIVYYESGKAVTLSVYQTVAGGGGAAGKAIRFTEFKGPGEHDCPEIGPGRVLVKADDADGDGDNLVMAAGKELTIGRINSHHISL